MNLKGIGDNVYPGDYRLHSSFKKAANFTGEKGFVSVVTEEVGAGPVSIVVDSLDASSPTLIIGEGFLVFDNRIYGTAGIPIYNSHISERDVNLLMASGLLKKSIFTGCSKSARCKAPANEQPERTRKYVRIASLRATPQMALFQQPARKEKGQGPPRLRGSPQTPARRCDSSPSTVWCWASPQHHTATEGGEFTRREGVPIPFLFYKSVSSFDNCLDLLEKTLLEEAPQRSLAFLLDKKREIYFSTGFERAFFDRITRGVGKMFGGELTVGVGLIRGLGFGLTPSGDDFLAGLLLGLNLREIIYGEHLRGFIAHVYETARGGSVFSDMLLALADKGLFTEHFKKLICAMLEGDRREILVASRRVLSQGETSGADTATGFMMALKMGHLLCY